MVKRKLMLFMSFLLVVFMVTSCTIPFEKGKQEKSEAETDKRNKDNIMDRGPVRGGVIKLFTTKPDTLNPLLTNNLYVRDLLGMVFEGLVKVDRSLNAIPQLAESWEVSEDELTWTFNIRKNVTWHDSVPFSAEDIEFTCQTLLSPNVNSEYKKNLENISEFAAIDKYTFRVVLKTPNSFTAEFMTFPIIPRHYFAAEDILKTERNIKPVGTGPYKLASYNQQEDIKLVFNDKWWGAKNSDASLPELPYITEVQAKIFEAGEESSNAFHASNVDVAYVSNADSVKYTGRQDIIMRKYTGRNYEFIAFNLSRPATGDKAVRQAIAHAIDKLKLINDILPGQAVSSPIPAFPGTWLNDSTVDYYSPNKEKAKEILEQGGWRQSSYGLYKYINGAYTTLNMEILVNEGNENRLRVAEYIAGQLKEIGINLQIKKADWNTGMNLVNTKRYDMALMGCHAPVIPDLSFLYASWNQYPDGNKAYNISGYSNPVADESLKQVLYERDINKRKMHFRNLKDTVMEDLPYLGLFFYNEAMLYNKRIRGEINPEVLDHYNGITHWYLP